jgi:hypothetical protein
LPDEAPLNFSKESPLESSVPLVVENVISSETSIHSISSAKKLTALLGKKVPSAAVQISAPIAEPLIASREELINIDPIQSPGNNEMESVHSVNDYYLSSATQNTAADRAHRLEEMMSSAASISDELHLRHPQLAELYNQKRKVVSEKIYGGAFTDTRYSSGATLRQDIAENTPSSILAAARSVLSSQRF